VAQASPWKFNPAEMRVPTGATVTFYLTSVDVQHGFKGTKVKSTPHELAVVHAVSSSARTAVR
jgi:heme/copper-type cytochrome/quinol oxidase subunit 2